MVKKEIILIGKKEMVDLVSYFYSKKDHNTYLIYNFNNEYFCGKTNKEKDLIKVYKLDKKDLENYDENLKNAMKMPFAVIGDIKVISISKIESFDYGVLEINKKAKKEINDMIPKKKIIKELNNEKETLKKKKINLFKLIMPFISIAIILFIIYVVLVYGLGAEITFA